MILHARTHPNLDVPGCFGCKVAGLQVAPSATPSRRGGARAAHVNATERQWDRDMAAYKRLRRNGVQPPGIDGCAVLEQQATDRVQIEGPVPV